MKKQYKAIVLFSGGLDSQLAVCVLLKQGIHVEAIIYKSPFFDSIKGEQAAKALGINYHILDFTEEILEQIQHPAHGFGKAMNPCIDCHAQMIRVAGKKMEEWGFDFIATGEVLAQRPMSQNKQSLGVVAKCSQYGDLLVRPLCAALIEPTKPIREGWIDVDQLPAFSGRNRTPQIKLAEDFGIKEYPAPAGGCLLTEPQFANKLKDLLDHEGLDHDRNKVWLLKTGRHLRIADDVKIIVGADQSDNEWLKKMAPPEALHITCVDIPGPTTLAPPNISDEQLKIAGAICARYAKTPQNETVEVKITQNNTSHTIEVLPLSPEEILQFMVVN